MPNLNEDNIDNKPVAETTMAKSLSGEYVGLCIKANEHNNNSKKPALTRVS